MTHSTKPEHIARCLHCKMRVSKHLIRVSKAMRQMSNDEIYALKRPTSEEIARDAQSFEYSTKNILVISQKWGIRH